MARHPRSSALLEWEDFREKGHAPHSPLSPPRARKRGGPLVLLALSDTLHVTVLMTASGSSLASADSRCGRRAVLAI